MSHVVSITTRVKDLKAAALAAQRMGGKLDTNKKTYTWWGKWVGDYNQADAAYLRGIKVEDYGKCDACVSFPDIDYEMGLVKMPEGDYQIIFDFISSDLTKKLGGTGAQAFLQAYGVEKTKLEAKAKGLKCSETAQADGSIKLNITGM